MASNRLLPLFAFKKGAKMDYKPLWGTVSHTGRTFTLHYRKTHLCTGIHKTGHDGKMFDGLQIPIVRFDKANIENVLNCISGSTETIREYYSVLPGTRGITLNQYLRKVRKHKIPVEYGFSG